MTRRIPALAVVVVLLAAPLLAACGSSYSGSSNSTTMRTQAAGAATVATSSTSLGTILVDGQGTTLYLFERDTGPRSTCSGACAQNWPPVTTDGAPKAGSGATASLLGTTTRSDGTTQVTYAGHPLYSYAGDASAGDTNGQGIDAYGAKWYVVAPSGSTITRQATGGSGAGGNGGYGY